MPHQILSTKFQFFDNSCYRLFIDCSIVRSIYLIVAPKIEPIWLYVTVRLNRLSLSTCSFPTATDRVNLCSKRCKSVRISHVVQLHTTDIYTRSTASLFTVTSYSLTRKVKILVKVSLKPPWTSYLYIQFDLELCEQFEMWLLQG